jgi:ATP-dependent helicase/nuclease subunit A
MPYLDIIRASAGSGKTHFLTGAFLNLLFQEPTDYFKGILAVTFTNKATAEMKSRMVKELHRLAGVKHSDYLKELIKITGFNEDHIRNKASAILHNILHDYSWFSIETIDSFFQRIIRGFTRELAIPGNYNIEITTMPILQYAVDQLIDSLEENTELLNWLVSFSEARIEEGRAWDVRRELIQLGREIFKEAFAIESVQIYEAIADKEKLNNYKSHLYSIKATMEKRLGELGKQGVEIMNEGGFQDFDFYQGTRGVGPYFKKLAGSQVILPNSYVLKLLEGPEYWPSGKSEKKKDIEDSASKYLLPLLEEVIQYTNNNYIHYNTATEILKNLYSLGILADLSKKVAAYLQENNSFLLSDSPVFIYKIIDNNEAPFIYEKMGNRYLHFMIDEFQDTSGLQWQNFKPLINNSLSQGHNCLLVGDVKQSIYRWRNSNWEVLGGQVLEEFPEEYLKLGALETNWRSGEYIVDFVAKVFPTAVDLLQNQFNAKAGLKDDSAIDKLFFLKKFYSDVKQQITDKSKYQGRVLIRFFTKNEISDNPDFYQQPLLENIDDMLQKGYSPGDIAVLVRSKKEGQLIANFLIEQNAVNRFSRDLTVISNESLLLGASEGINLITAAMQYILLPDDAINRGKLVTGYRALQFQINTPSAELEIIFEHESSSLEKLNSILPEEFTGNLNAFTSYSLYELVERLIQIFKPDTLETETPYIHAFLDVVHEYTRTNPSDLGKFLDFWSDEGIDKSIPSSESQDALRILTIHKSKGLEFRAVIIPFCNWALDPKPNTILWSRPESRDLDYFPVIPVNFSKNLLETEFENSYLEELFKSYVDNLNLLYVAMTRAIDNLIILSAYREPGQKEIVISTVGDLIHETFVSPDREDIQASFNRDLNIFETGEVKKSENNLNPIRVDKYITSTEGSPATGRLFFDPSGYEYFTDSFTNTKNPIIQGRVLHEILAQITTVNDIDKATSDAVFRGLITEKESSDLREHLFQGFENLIIKKWFDGSGEVRTESDIIISNGEIRRPDRVVIYSDHVDIIDYKSGIQEENESHNFQVNEYIRLISGIGYKNVKGYLWYINSNNVKEIST